MQISYRSLQCPFCRQRMRLTALQPDLLSERVHATHRCVSCGVELTLGEELYVVAV